MGRGKKFPADHAMIHGCSTHPKEFVFVDKRTGTRRFEVKADRHGKMPVEEVVSLLAIHCVARHQMPRDFGMMVAAGQGLFHGIAKRATKLIRSCSGYQYAWVSAELATA